MLDLAESIGDDLAAQVDVLLEEIVLPTAEQLGCWRTLLPAIADLVAEVGGRLQAGEDLLSRLPAWVLINLLRCWVASAMALSRSAIRFRPSRTPTWSQRRWWPG